MTDRRLLLAGSVGPERVPARPDPEAADWYLPLHLRDERAARERLAAQVVVGADVIVAPTWLTHRRALMPLGETRRAAAWTAAAIRLAREAVEIGLERREESLADATAVAEDDIRRGRPRPIVAASLPALDGEPEPGTGRLLPREAATERDYRDQAGILADAAPDLLLVEGQAAEADARLACAEASETGLPVWAALNTASLALSGLEAWLEWARDMGLARLLLPPPLEERLAVRDGQTPWGGLLHDAAQVSDWLDAGAGSVALLDGASVAALEPLRVAIDEPERVGVEAAQTRERRWSGAVRQAASMAPGGAAVWIGPTPADGLPDGFDWLVVEAAESRHLPAGHYRLVVTLEPVNDLGPLVQPDGVLLRRGFGDAESDLSILSIDDTADPPIVIERREA